MKFGIVVFPGSWSQQDFYHVIVNVLKEETCYLWHKEADLKGSDCVILPGGFAHGDYLGPARAILSYHGQVAVRREGRPRAREPQRVSDRRSRAVSVRLWTTVCTIVARVHLRVESQDTLHGRMQRGQVVRMPISHGEGRYYIDRETFKRLADNDQVIFRYCDERGNLTKEANPNGSLDHVAGVCNKRRNVLGLMPHPERAAEAILGSEDGRLMFASILDTFARA
jgi:phosphoribosylformylglycinamidine synthase